MPVFDIYRQVDKDSIEMVLVDSQNLTRAQVINFIQNSSDTRVGGFLLRYDAEIKVNGITISLKAVLQSDADNILNRQSLIQLLK